MLAAATWPAVYRLFWPGYLSTYDGIYHLTRMIEVDSLARQGILYPRWFPDFGQGHGYPIFNFFPPFGYLLTEIPALITGDVARAIQISMAASMVVAAWGMYLLARACKANRMAAIAAGGLYLYFPYHLQDLYTRGGMPELWAMAWLPWLIWAQTRAVRRGSACWIAWTGLLGAIEIGTHNIMAVFLLPLALAVSLMLGPRCRAALATGAGGSMLSIALAAGYWLPALIEAPLTRVRQLAGDWLPDHTFAVTNLVDGVFFAPYGGKTYRLTAFAAGALAVLAVALLVHGLLLRRWLPEGGLVLAGAATAVLLTRWSVPFWLNAPLMGYIQFPWRLLAVMGFLGALMAALVGSWHRAAWAPLLAAACVMAWASLGRAPDNRFALSPPLDARILETQEYGSALDGVAIESEYQPRTSAPDLMKAAQGRRLPEDTTPPARLDVRKLSWRGTDLQATVEARETAGLRLQMLLYPGWRAWLDGRSWPLRPGTAAGLIEATIPQGVHTLDVRYTGTPLEGLAGLLSGATLLGTGLWLARRRPAVMSGLVVAGVAAGWLVTHPLGNPNTIYTASWPASNGQRLVGYEGPRLTARGIEADLWWLTATPEEPAFDFVVRRGGGAVVARIPASSAATTPYQYLAANELTRRYYTLPAALEPGEYTVSVEAAGRDQELGTIRLPSPPDGWRAVRADFQDETTLTGYKVDRLQAGPGLTPANLATKADAAARPGDFLLVSLRWASRRVMDQNYVTFVHLLDRDQKTWASHDNQPNGTLQATSSWVPGQVITDRFVLKLPATTPPGMYRLEAGLYHIDEHGYHFLPLAGGGNSVLFGAIKVEPAHEPAAGSAAVARWSNGIALQRWDMERQGQDVALTFTWGAGASVADDYTLFVHLSDGSGKVVGQADGEPQGGSFPTRLWDPGDTLRDTHAVRSPPPGRYRLTIGWYKRESGERVPLESGGDELDLGELSTP